MALGYKVCPSFIWLSRLVSRNTRNFSTVFMYLPLDVKCMGAMMKSMGPNEWWCFSRCSAKFDLYYLKITCLKLS
jgi:hypothetical protein